MSDWDCGDGSCVFAQTKGGRRTNGGCTCLGNRGIREPELTAVFMDAMAEGERRGRVAALRLGGQLIGDMIDGRVDPDPRKLAEYLLELAASLPEAKS